MFAQNPNPFTAPSPREVYLEDRVKRLESENQYLRNMTAADRRYSILDEPETFEVNHRSATLNLAAEVSVEQKKPFDSLHVLVRERGYPNNLGLSYFISRQDLSSARDRAAVLGFLHEKAMRQIGEAFA